MREFNSEINSSRFEAIPVLPIRGTAPDLSWEGDNDARGHRVCLQHGGCGSFAVLETDAAAGPARGRFTPL